ncbi:MAG: hypothetical protein A2X86_22160 [Bdellovibrionales bacterium GWA2_49_15]|nr:MAG: hypothetical protein A2X86_22160 [Bdellovibrionales bacterium GWA2_49_15]HAZ14817.1 hypothetical protein [Bdellovibrionales bacterium]
MIERFFKKGLLLCVLLMLLVVPQSWGAPVIEGQDINHVIGIYVGPRGLNLIENNFDKLLEANGFSSNSYFFEKIEKTMDPMTFEQLVPNPKLQAIAKQVRTYFRQFFRGFTIKNEHQFQVTADGIEITGEWEKGGVKVLGNTIEELTNRSGVRLQANFKARALRLYVDKARARDLKHAFLGDIGVDGFYLELADGTHNPLEISLDAQAYVMDNAGIDLRLGDIKTNIATVPLQTSFRSPMILPVVEIRINGRRAFLRASEVEKLLREQLPKLVTGLRETIQKTLDENLIPLARERAAAFLSKSHVEINQMEPVGVEAGKQDVNYRWGIYPRNVEVLPGPMLHAGLNGYVYDPKFRDDLSIPAELVASNPPAVTSFSGVEFDLALSLNQGLINRMLQYGQRRQYFSNMKTKTGEKLALTTAPKLTLVGKGASNKPATLTINTKYTVTGWQKIFVRNPIQIKMDLELDFSRTSDGKNPMLVKGIDVESGYIDGKFIRLFKKTVRKKMKDKLKDISKAVSGMVLSEDLPLPKELGGIPIQTKLTRIDPNGHLVIFMDLGLTQ